MDRHTDKCTGNLRSGDVLSEGDAPPYQLPGNSECLVYMSK